MKHRIALVSAMAVAAAFAATGAQAVVYDITASGTVNRIARIDDGVFSGRPGAGPVFVGDEIRLSFRLNSAATRIGRVLAADPSANVYSWSPESVRLTMGDYAYTPARVSSQSSYVVLWNDRDLCCGRKADAQSFSIYDDPFGAAKASYPIATGPGHVSESISLSMLDFTNGARSSDGIDEIVDPVRFGTRLFEYGLQNSTTNLYYRVFANNMAVSIAAVPEPATWATMIGGLGLVGASARRRRRPAAAA